METSTKFITIGSSDLIPSQTKFEVIIIGAGLSGLSAAKWLQEWGVHNILILEARDRVGGRTLSKKNPNVKYVDLGASYVGPTQDHVLRMAKDLGIQTYVVHDPPDEKTVFYSKKYGRSTFYRDSLPRSCNPLVTLDVNHFFRLLDSMGEQIPADAPWKAPLAAEWDKTSMKEFAEKHLFTKGGREFVETICNAFVTVGAYEASMLWFLWYVKQGKGCKRFISNTNGAQERKFVGGSQQVSEKIADMLGGKLLLNKVVCEIDQRGHGVVVNTLDGSEYEAEYVILAVPPSLQLQIHYKPPLPDLRNQMIQKVPMGSVFKVHMYYEKTFWRDKGLCGTSVISGDEEHPICFTFDDTKPDGSFPALVGFIGGERARQMAIKTPEERKAIIAQSFAKVFDSQEALKPIHYEEFNWMAEQYSGGCYTSVFPPGSFATYGRILREPINRLYFAGTETSIVWSGYMDGAIAAGERAAREVLHALGKIASNQIWREEPESKEIPALPFPKSFIADHLPSAHGFVKFLSMSTLLLGIGTGAFLYHRVCRLAR